MSSASIRTRTIVWSTGFLRDRLVIVAPVNIDNPIGGAVVPVVVRGSPDIMKEWVMSTQAGISTFSIDPVFRLSSLLNIRDAVRIGVGAVRLPISLVSYDIASGRLAKWGMLKVRISGFGRSTHRGDYRVHAFPLSSITSRTRFRTAHRMSSLHILNGRRKRITAEDRLTASR